MNKQEIQELLAEYIHYFDTVEAREANSRLLALNMHNVLEADITKQDGSRVDITQGLYNVIDTTDIQDVIDLFLLVRDATDFYMHTQEDEDALDDYYSYRAMVEYQPCI
jgi:hypothetical protein